MTHGTEHTVSGLEAKKKTTTSSTSTATPTSTNQNDTEHPVILATSFTCEVSLNEVRVLQAVYQDFNQQKSNLKEEKSSTPVGICGQSLYT